MRSKLILILAIALPLIAGFAGSLFTTPQIPGWYEGLVKPFLNPPSWIFAPVWTLLYVLMGYASYLVYKNRNINKNLANKALGLYAVHLLANLSWSLVFFGGQNPDMALAIIALLWAMIVVLALLFSRINKRAALLLVPYLFWVTFATYLNASIVFLN